MHPTPRPPRLLSLLATAILLIGASSTVALPAGAVPIEEAPQAEAEVPAPPSRPFLDVPGVDLRALGHDGPAIDPDLVERMGEALPTDPYERAVEVTHRLDLAPPQLESLIDADERLGAAVASLAADVARAQGAVQMGARRAEVAAQRLQDATTRLQARTDELALQRSEMAEVAVAAYVRPPDADVLAKVIGGVATTTRDLSAPVLFSAKADYDGEVRDSMEVRQAVGQEQAERAEADRTLAVRMSEEAARRLADAEQRHEAFRTAFDQVHAARLLLEEQIPVLRDDLERTIAEAWGSLGDPASLDPNAVVELVDVGGIRVHPAIAPGLYALLTAAHADGVPLGGWGYRNVDQQIALRRANCGPTPEDVYLKPAGQCSPPTARPGASMHERGLAIDFHLGGQSISSQGSPAYQWLAANAQQFGFQNLPSEPWHWSVNGE